MTNERDVRIKFIDIVIPAHNEDGCSEEMGSRGNLVFEAESSCSWHVIHPENWSRDNTGGLLRRACAQDDQFTVARRACNFHMDGGLTAGLEVAAADAAVFNAAVLQDPTEGLPTIGREREAGFYYIYGEVTAREGTCFIQRLSSQALHWLDGRATDGRTTRQASDFLLMFRTLYLTVRGLAERNFIMRGLVAWAGFTSKAVTVPRPPQCGGGVQGIRLDRVHGYRRFRYFPLVRGIFGVRVKLVRYGVERDRNLSFVRPVAYSGLI